MTADELAELAVETVREAGGQITFAEYDSAMFGKKYFPAPFSWIAGWELHPAARKRNTDKMCAFAACKRNLIEQTDTGYKIVERAK